MNELHTKVSCIGPVVVVSGDSRFLSAFMASDFDVQTQVEGKEKSPEKDWAPQDFKASETEG